MTLPPIHFPHVDWARDWQWVGYETDAGGPVPPPHTWQDWIVTGLMFAVAAAGFLAIAWIWYLWRSGQLELFRRALGDD